MDTINMKSIFYNELHNNRKNLANNTSFLSDEKYNELIEIISELKVGCKKKEPKDFRVIKRYDVLVVQGKTKLIFPVKDDNVVLYCVLTSELFDILQATHISIGHGGRDQMINELGNKYKNITRNDIETFLHFCEPCQQKQKGSKKRVVVTPIISSDFKSRCQVDLIDFQSHPDGKFKFIMVYQDHLTKFVVLKPLKFKRAEEVAYNIIDTFTLLGAPTILQSDNGREFSNQIVSNLRNMWPELKIVHGKPRHSQSQGSVERANQDIENIEGLRFIQLMKNRAYDSGIKMSPCEALFGCKIKIGLNISNSLHDVISTIENEKQLAEIITEQSQNIENEGSADTEQPQNIENETSDTEQQLATTIKLNNENSNVM
ncbi:hypothetical protein QTP88_000544 [Uroleucon formosanum]